MGDFTTRLGLFKPNPTDWVSILDDLANNMGKIDDPTNGAVLLNYPGQVLGVPLQFAATQFGVPVAVTPDGVPATGSATSTLSVSNHQHGVATYALTPLASAVAGSAGTSGTAPSRGDHVHPLALAPLATITSNVTSATTTELVVVNNQFAAGYLGVGTTVGFKASGTLSASASGTLTARIRAGTTGTTADTQVCSTGAVGAVTTAVGFYLDGQVTVRSVGSTGTAVGNMTLFVGTVLGISAQTATVTVNTTPGTPFLDLTLQNGGTSPSLTVVTASIHIMRG